MKKDLRKYLQNIIEDFPVYNVSDSDKRIISNAGMHSYIFRKISSRKFRSSSMPEDLEELVKSNIRVRVEGNRPIAFSIPIGGYKKRQLPSAPTVDWAEFFNMSFMSKLAAPVLGVYKPGVVIEYVSNEIDMEILGNYKRDELEAYTDSFKKLLSHFNKFFPENFKIVYRETRAQFKKREYEESLKKAKSDLDRLYKEFDKLSDLEKKKKIEKAGRNYKFSLEEEKLSKEEKQKVLKRVTLIHDMYVSPIWLGILAKKDYIRNNNKIPVSYYHCNWGIHLGSCSTSTTQFWVGYGILEERENRFLERILSFEQYKKIKSRLLEVKIDLISQSNFDKINILRK